MTFKYSICHPDNPDIEYRNDPISGNQVLEIARNYPWLEKLKLIDSLAPEQVHYSPSLDFIRIIDGISFCLTANYDKDENLEFSLWYNRPKMVKVLFGLLGEKEKMVVDEVWEISFDKAMEYLEQFVYGNLKVLERLYQK